MSTSEKAPHAPERRHLSQRLLYRIPFALVVLVMASGGVIDALQLPFALEQTRHLGYPDYFATMIGLAKLLGVIALVAPVPRTLREWAYAGFTFDVCGAIVSITAVGDAPGGLVIPLITLAALQLSYFSWRRDFLAPTLPQFPARPA
jgi:hypothetical protein